MKEIIIATNNAGKGRDFEALFNPLGIKVLTLKDVAENINVEETGITFEENAILKAETVAKILGKMVIADDSGLEIDALEGGPGVYSARYAGLGSTDDENINKVLSKLSTVEGNERTARFQCVLAIAGPTIETQTFSGSCDGLILPERLGENGFGYDPIFYIPTKEKSMGELTAVEKSLLSHRGAALALLQAELPQLLNARGQNS